MYSVFLLTYGGDGVTGWPTRIAHYF